MLMRCEIEHLRKRMADEQMLATSTSSLAARLVHEELARIYRQRLRAGTGNGDAG